MKKYIALAVLAMTVASCTDDASEEGVRQSVIEVSASVDAATRAEAASMPSRCVVQVFNDDGTAYTGQGARQVLELSGDGHTDFKVSVVTGRKYRLAFWADSDNGAYDAASLDGVKINAMPVDTYALPAADNRYEAYSASMDVFAGEDGSRIAVALRRATCHVRLSATAAAKADGQLSVWFTCPAEYNVADGTVSGSSLIRFGEAQVTASTLTDGFLECALPAGNAESVATVKWSLGGFDRDATFPLKRNYVMNVTGGFFSAG